MNKNGLKRLQYKNVRLRPLAVRLGEMGEKLPELDDEWFVERVDPGGVHIVNGRNRYCATLPFDGIVEFREPNFLILKIVVITGVPHVGVRYEPLPDPRSARRH